MDKRKGNTDLTEGKVWKVIVRFAVPLLVGNLLQQFYNITDSIIDRTAHHYRSQLRR